MERQEMVDSPVYLIVLDSEKDKKFLTAYGDLHTSFALARADIKWFLQREYPNVKFAIIEG